MPPAPQRTLPSASPWSARLVSLANQRPAVTAGEAWAQRIRWVVHGRYLRSPWGNHHRNLGKPPWLWASPCWFMWHHVNVAPSSKFVDQFIIVVPSYLLTTPPYHLPFRGHHLVCENNAGQWDTSTSLVTIKLGKLSFSKFPFSSFNASRHLDNARSSEHREI